MLLVSNLTPARPMPDHPLVVDLVLAPGPRQAQVRTPAATPAAPPESPPPDVARIETRTPPPTKPLPEQIEPAKKPRKDPDPPPRRAAAQPPPADPAPAEAADGIVSEDGSSSLTPLEGGDVEFAWYRSAVTAALYGRWRRPLLERQIETIEVQVSFEILRDGSVRGLRIVQSSGVPTLDRTALRAVSDADPLPPLPPNWRDPVLPATFLFRLHPE